jgi:hypothetical protein
MVGAGASFALPWVTMRPLLRTALGATAALSAALLAGCLGYASPARASGDVGWGPAPVAPCPAEVEPAPRSAPLPLALEESSFSVPQAPSRPPSISLGYAGDKPLTPSPHTPRRWPWVEERFPRDSWSGVSFARRRR